MWHFLHFSVKKLKLKNAESHTAGNEQNEDLTPMILYPSPSLLHLRNHCSPSQNDSEIIRNMVHNTAT